MADAVYAIEDFPDDDLLWRIEWIGGVGYYTSVPSDHKSRFALRSFPPAKRIRSARDHVPLSWNPKQREQ
jgi:hypothetical protein